MARNPEQVQRGKVYPQPQRGPSLMRLPLQYAEAIFRPKPETFARESEYASWGLVWFQILLLLIIPVVLGILRSVLRDHSEGINTNTNVIFAFLGALSVGATIIAFILKIVLVPVIFFVGMFLQWIIAKSFRGRQNRFLPQCYAVLLYQVPLTLIAGLIILLFVIFHFSTFFFSPIVSIVFFIIGIFLNISVIMGVHRLRRGQATATVIIPYIIGLLAIWGGIALFAHYVSTAAH